MPLTIKLISEHRDLVGTDCVREYYEDGGTIGRSLQNDWILPDPDRFISGRHATIDFRGGMYYLADTSSNGVYMNGDLEPIGKGNPRRLFDGDRMRMGDFEFEIHIDKGESLVMPLDEEPSVAPDNIEQFVDEDLLQTGMQMLDEDEITGDDAFRSVLFGEDSGTAPKPDFEAEPEVELDTDLDIDPKPATHSANDESASDSGDEISVDDLFDSFLDGLGISRVEFHPAVDRAEVMMTAGLLLREFVDGTVKLLDSRADLKNTFRLDQTTVLPRRNNPMKFAENTGDLLRQLLIGSEGKYLGARDAVREANSDLLNHQNAFLEAMNKAFVEFSSRFDPDELQVGFEQSMDNKLLSFNSKSKYWDLYRDTYSTMTETGGGRFPQTLAEEFVRAYEKQVSKFRRQSLEEKPAPKTNQEVDPAFDPGLLATQKLDGPITASKGSNDRSSDEDGIVEAMPVDNAGDLDEGFVDTLAEAINRDRSKA
jgi:type VI secretion system FHA domain protein